MEEHKLTTFKELKDKYYPEGSFERDKFDAEVKKEIIIEGNKVLARYLGYEYFPFNSEEKDLRWGWYLKSTNKQTRHKNSKLGSNSLIFLGRHHKDLRFCNDWNLLMRVYSKLFSSLDHIKDTDNMIANAQEELIKANREEFFYSLVKVVNYLESKNGEETSNT